MITEAKLKLCCPHADTSKLLPALLKFWPAAGIDNVHEFAHFISQCAHESSDFTRFEENLNYRADALFRTWPKRFPTDAVCAAYAHNQEKIANRAYANRMGNGDEASGDGWATHGRGAIQLTGMDNYRAFAKASNKSIAELKTYLIVVEGAVESACWFWTVNDLNRFAQANDVERLTRAINGGTIGLDDRRARFEKCLAVLSA
jgi:putative chitinase